MTTPVEDERIKRYQDEALLIVEEIFKLTQPPSALLKKELAKKSKADKLMVARSLFKYIENPSEQVLSKLRDLDSYLVEIRKIREGRVGEWPAKKEGET